MHEEYVSLQQGISSWQLTIPKHPNPHSPYFSMSMKKHRVNIYFDIFLTTGLKKMNLNVQIKTRENENCVKTGIDTFTKWKQSRVAGSTSNIIMHKFVLWNRNNPLHWFR